MNTTSLGLFYLQICRTQVGKMIAFIKGNLLPVCKWTRPGDKRGIESCHYIQYHPWCTQWTRRQFFSNNLRLYEDNWSTPFSASCLLANNDSSFFIKDSDLPLYQIFIYTATTTFNSLSYSFIFIFNFLYINNVLLHIIKKCFKGNKLKLLFFLFIKI